MIGRLVEALRADVTTSPPRTCSDEHLDGIGAIIESHFRFERPCSASSTGSVCAPRWPTCSAV